VATSDVRTWSFGDLLEGIDGVLPADAPAIRQGELRRTWGELARRTNNLAAALVARGARPDDKVAFYLRNGPEYVEALAACFKARLVHANVNYRYLDDELLYILDNSDARFVVYDAEFEDRVAALRGRVRDVLCIRTGAEAPPGGVAFEPLAEEGAGAPLGLERSGDDLVFMYTGGTTGLPKAVMWRHADLWGALGSGRNARANRGEAPADPATHVRNVGRQGPGPVQMPVCPLMHGTGLFSAIGHLLGGGSLVLTRNPSFDPEEVLDTIDACSVQSIVIVGDAFARPLLRTLAAEPGRWDLSSLKVILSSGVMWSREVKQGLLAQRPHLLLADLFGSSEAVGFGSSVTSAEQEGSTARFRIGEHCRVFTEDHREVQPGSGERGLVARSGPIPLGYYKDPEKTAATFPTIDGVRWSIPGDWCTVEADGTLDLLGRGSACINTAGEKVYPEEVEEALKAHPAVEDALVVGVPDERWGQAVTAVVEPSGDPVDEEALRAHVRERLAGYKTPKRVLSTERMFRAPNGKADYRRARDFALEQLGLSE